MQYTYTPCICVLTAGKIMPWIGSSECQIPTIHAQGAPISGSQSGGGPLLYRTIDQQYKTLLCGTRCKTPLVYGSAPQDAAASLQHRIIGRLRAYNVTAATHCTARCACLRIYVNSADGLCVASRCCWRPNNSTLGCPVAVGAL